MMINETLRMVPGGAGRDWIATCDIKQGWIWEP